LKTDLLQVVGSYHTEFEYYNFVVQSFENKIDDHNLFDFAFLTVERFRNSDSVPDFVHSSSGNMNISVMD
jgi:hypothetical protein